MTHDSITGVSWNTCIGTRIICIYILLLKKWEKQDTWGIILRCLNPYKGKGYGSLTAINWYLTYSIWVCDLLEVGSYKERADIDAIKSSLLKDKNPIADCYRVENQPGATNRKRCQKPDVSTPVKIMYINMVMPRQWYNMVLKRTLFLLFYFYSKYYS